MPKEAQLDEGLHWKLGKSDISEWSQTVRVRAQDFIPCCRRNRRSKHAKQGSKLQPASRRSKDEVHEQHNSAHPTGFGRLLTFATMEAGLLMIGRRLHALRAVKLAILMLMLIRMRYPHSSTVKDENEGVVEPLNQIPLNLKALR
jgi:hypothetical protein